MLKSLFKIIIILVLHISFIYAAEQQPRTKTTSALLPQLKRTCTSIETSLHTIYTVTLLYHEKELGYITVMLKKRPKKAVLKDLWVTSEHRNQGLGDFLFSYAKHICKKHHYTHMEWHARPFNDQSSSHYKTDLEKLLRFYTARGAYTITLPRNLKPYGGIYMQCLTVGFDASLKKEGSQ